MNKPGLTGYAFSVVGKIPTRKWRRKAVECNNKAVQNRRAKAKTNNYCLSRADLNQHGKAPANSAQPCHSPQFMFRQLRIHLLLRGGPRPWLPMGSYGKVTINPYSMQQAIPLYERSAGTRPCGSCSRVSRLSLSDAVVASQLCQARGSR